jgi:hypothetical protein
MSPVVCEDCDDPVVPTVTGWYRCRMCGYESLRAPVPRPSSGLDSYIDSQLGSAAGAGLVSLFDKS